jgi:hypothetical protein
LTRAIEKWKYGHSGETGEKIPYFIHQCQALPLQLQENIALSVIVTKHIITEIQSAFGFPRVHSEFKYHNFISSYSGDEILLGSGEIERQQKCKIHGVGLCILGCFEEYHTKT